MKEGRRWDANCAKTRQLHKKSFPYCIVLFMAKYKNRRKSHLVDDSDYDFAADVRKGRYEGQANNIEQVEKDEK